MKAAGIPRRAARASVRPLAALAVLAALLGAAALPVLAASSLKVTDANSGQPHGPGVDMFTLDYTGNLDPTGACGAAQQTVTFTWVDPDGTQVPLTEAQVAGNCHAVARHTPPPCRAAGTYHVTGALNGTDPSTHSNDPATANYGLDSASPSANGAPCPSPSPAPSPTPTVRPTPTPTAGRGPSPTPSRSVSPAATASPSPSASTAATPSAAGGVSPSPSAVAGACALAPCPSPPTTCAVPAKLGSPTGGPPWPALLAAAALLALVGGGAILYFRSASKPGLAALAVIVVVATAGAVLMTGGAAVAAGAAGPSAFLRLDDLRGDASDAAHPGAIELTSVGPAAMLPPKLGGSFGPIQVGKGADRATAALFEAAASGRHFKCGFIFLSRTAGYDNVVYALSDVTVADFTQGAAEPGAATETLTLTYRVIAWSYQPLGPDGSPQGPAVRAGWDPVSKHAVTP